MTRAIDVTGTAALTMAGDGEPSKHEGGIIFGRFVTFFTEIAVASLAQTPLQ
jgi:hypothetical protein